MSSEQTLLVSIILPTYNRADVLAGAINSVLAQSYKNFELIIVDDNSPDNTSEVVQSFDDKRIQYVKNKINLKLPGALNRGFEQAKGEFLTWTSDDNFFTEQAIEEMVSVLQGGKYGLVYADYYEFSEMDNEAHQPKDPKLVNLPDTLSLEKGNQVGACFLYTRKAYESVGEYDTGLFLVEDYDYWMRIHALFAVKHIDKPLYYFRRDDNTLYCSRFAEVKTSDLLVRYKNDLLDKNEVVEKSTDLILRNIERLTNPLYRVSYRIIKPISYRLSTAYINLMRYYIKIKIKNKIFKILNDYDNRNISFRVAKDILKETINSVASIEYQ